MPNTRTMMKTARLHVQHLFFDVGGHILPELDACKDIILLAMDDPVAMAIHNQAWQAALKDDFPLTQSLCKDWYRAVRRKKAALLEGGDSPRMHNLA